MYAVGEGTPHNVHIHKRGDPTNLGPEAPRRFLQILGGQPLPADCKGSGRLQLAEWLSSPKNPLTARVMVNRIWQHHFGEGLVRTPNNFGKQGRPPTHPELLDYLADRFVAGGWSVKAMHKMILLSRSYQLSSADDEHDRALDPNNEALWRFDRRRLDAEAIRDSLLAVSGALDRTMAGPQPFPPANTWNFTQHSPFQAVYETNHRSVYLMTQRHAPPPVPGPVRRRRPQRQHRPARRRRPCRRRRCFSSTTRSSTNRRSGSRPGCCKPRRTTAARIDLAHRIVYGRPATLEETRAGEMYLRKYAQGLKDAGVPPEKQAAAAWASYRPRAVRRQRVHLHRLKRNRTARDARERREDKD